MTDFWLGVIVAGSLTFAIGGGLLLWWAWAATFRR